MGLVREVSVYAHCGSLASRPADRGFDRMAEIKVPFHPVKCGFGRMGTQLEVFARSKHTINH